MTIAIDFDGTIVEHRYPKIGNEIPFATDTLKMLMKDHHRLILWTVREGELLKEAVEWCRERGVEFYAINRDYPEEDAAHHGFSRKVKADIFIDDRNLGGLPDWGDIYRMIQKKLTYEELYRNMDEAPPRKLPRKRENAISSRLSRNWQRSLRKSDSTIFIERLFLSFRPAR